jgi:hypothetical protein
MGIKWFCGVVAEDTLRELGLAQGMVVTNGFVRGHLVGVSESGLLSRVLVIPGVKKGNKPVPLDEREERVVETRSLRSLRGRPMKVNIFGLLRRDVERLCHDEGYAREAMDFLFGHQTTDERAIRQTTYDNDRGFRKNHALQGTALAEKTLWSLEDFTKAREILGWYCGTQLLEREIERRSAYPG